MQSCFDFNKKAETYDDFYLSDFGKETDRQEKKCVWRFLKKIKALEILELGSGTGHWSAWFSEKGFTVLGIDVAEEMLKKARSKKISNCHFTKMSMCDLKFEDNSKDLIIAITSLEFTSDREKSFREINRVLRPGGHFIAGVLNRDSIIGINKNNNESFKNAHFFTEDEIREALSAYGKVEICRAAYINSDLKFNKEDSQAAMIVAHLIKR